MIKTKSVKVHGHSGSKYLTIFIPTDNGVCLLRGWTDGTSSILRPDSKFIFTAFLQISDSEGRLQNINIVSFHPDF